MNNIDENEWIACKATFVEENGRFNLSFTSGSFSVSKYDLQFNGEDLLLRKGADIIVLSEDFPTNYLISSPINNPCECPSRIISTNREERIPKHGCSTKCFGVVMICYYCVYDIGGVLIGEESKVCGICVGIPF